MHNRKFLINKPKFFTGFTMFMIAAYIFQMSFLFEFTIYWLFIKVPFFIALAYIVINIRNIRFDKPTIILLLYVGSMFISSYFSSGVSLNLIMYISLRIFLILSVNIAMQKNHMKTVIQGFLVYFLLECLLNDIIWIMLGFAPLVEPTGGKDVLNHYLIGNKFGVMYSHIILCALSLSLYHGKHRKKCIILWGVLLIILSLSFDSATTAVSSLAMMIMLLLEGKKKSIFESKKTLAIFFAISAVFPFLSEGILSLNFVQAIVVTILHRKLTLTGRTKIFTYILYIANLNLLWGTGRYESTTTVLSITGAYNIQNGFWQIFISYGIIGAVLLVCSVLCSVRTPHRQIEGVHDYSILILVYTFIVIGFVEVPYDRMILPLVIISAICNDHRKPIRNIQS